MKLDVFGECSALLQERKDLRIWRSCRLRRRHDGRDVVDTLKYDVTRRECEVGGGREDTKMREDAN